MKKKLVLLLTLIVSLFIYCGRVDAAKELTCIYKKYDKNFYGQEIKTICYYALTVQDSNGNYYTFGGSNQKLMCSDDDPENSIDYYKNSSSFVLHSGNKWKLNYKDKKMGSNYSECPNDDGDWKLVNSYNEVFSKIAEYDKEINKTKWDAKCSYKDLDLILYYNREKMSAVYSEGENYSFNFNSIFHFEAKDMYNVYYGTCPTSLYYTTTDEYGDDDSDEYSSSGSLTTVYDIYLEKGYNGTKEVELSDYVHFKTDDNSSNGSGQESISNCDGLFGAELIDKITSYFNIIKIAVPILLIGFGIFDFAKAVFSGEEDMKKSKKRFIIRIAASILFFLSPIFVKFFLSIANKAWDIISPNTCLK